MSTIRTTKLESIVGTYGLCRATGKEQAVEVRCDERVAIRSSPDETLVWRAQHAPFRWRSPHDRVTARRAATMMRSDALMIAQRGRSNAKGRPYWWYPVTGILGRRPGLFGCGIASRVAGSATFARPGAAVLTGACPDSSHRRR